MNLSELNDLDFENPGGWPLGFKLFTVVLLAILIGVGGYFLKTKEQYANLQRLAKQEVKLKSDFQAKQEKAALLDGYKAQLEEMKIILQSMLRQLPSKTEMPDLLVDVSQTAIATGIETQTFSPGVESPKSFYAEKPIRLKMLGTFHEFGAFVSGVASLHRVVILTMHDITLTPADQSERPGELMLEGTAKTYRYLEDNEEFTGLEDGK